MALKTPNLAQYHFPNRSLLLAAMAQWSIPNEAVSGGLTLQSPSSRAIDESESVCFMLGTSATAFA
jgi:hypothetical protein